MIEFRSQPEQWIIVFQSMEPESAFPPGDRVGKVLRRLLRRILRRGFQHVFAMRRADHFDGWIMVNMRGSGLDVIEIRGNDYLHDIVLPMCRTPDAALVLAEIRDNGFMFRNAFNCVQFIGHLLGLKLGIFTTPWCLYNILIAKQEAPYGHFYRQQKTGHLGGGSGHARRTAGPRHGQGENPGENP